MEIEDRKAMVSGLLQPWHEAVSDPPAAQEAVLKNLLSDYAKTEYGLQHNAGDVSTITEYRKAFPIATYEDFKPLIQTVIEGEVNLILAEEPELIKRSPGCTLKGRLKRIEG